MLRPLPLFGNGSLPPAVWPRPNSRPIYQQIAPNRSACATTPGTRPDRAPLSPSGLSPQLAESLAKLKRVIDLETAAAKRDLARWLDQMPNVKDPTVITVALLETALDRYLAERAGSSSTLSAAAADALEMIQPILRRAVQRRRAALRIHESGRGPALPVNDEECVSRLTEMLKLLDAIAGPLPQDAALRRFIDDAAEPLGTLLGYFAGGIDRPPAFDATEPSRRRTFPLPRSEPEPALPAAAAEIKSPVTPHPAEDR
jgi:hypothetical protein